jgi:AAA family ATP:ADP antiporter
VPKVCVLERAAELLQIRKGEGGLVGALFVHAFLGGIPLTLTTMAGSALFLEQHGAVLLPWAYLAAAVVVPSAGWLCLRIQDRLAFDRFLLAVVALLCLGDLASWAGLRLLGAERGTWGLPVWTELEYSLTGLQLWSLGGRLLNVQQAKRLFGVIGSGAMLSAGITGLASPLFVHLIGTEQLLLLSASASFVSLILLRRLCARERDRLGADLALPEGKGLRERKARTRNAGSAPPELRSYERAMYALMALAFISYYVIERVFYDRAEARLPETEALASFLGVLLGVSGFLGLLLRGWLGARLLARFGLLLGLMALPVLVTVGASGATIAGTTLGLGSAALFWTMSLTRAGAGVLRESLDLQAGLMLYQPLPRAQRVKVQTIAESVVGPLAGGVASAGLIAANAFGFDVLRLTLVLAVLGVAWAYVANHLAGAYRRVLEHALADHRLDPGELVLDESARAPLLRALGSPFPAEVLYALDMLEEMGWQTEHKRLAEERPATILKNLLRHEVNDVRREALRRIQRRGLTELLPDVATLAGSDPDARVRGRAFRVLAAIGDDDEAERVFFEAARAEPRIQRQVMTGCLASGCLDRIALAWAELRRLTESSDAAQRIQAAQVLRKVATPAFYRPLLRLLGDPDRQVRRAALVACKTIHHPLLLPLVVNELGSRALRSAAAAALVAIGEPALAQLRDFAHEQPDWRVRVRSLRIAGKLKGRASERLALDMLGSKVEEVRHASLLALVACGHRQHDHRATYFESETRTSRIFEKLLRTEISEATWTLGALRDLDSATASPRSLAGGAHSQALSSNPLSDPNAIEDEGLALVVQGLRRELSASRERILLLLSFLFDADNMHTARANYGSKSGERRAFVLELLENALPQTVRAKVFPLFDDVAASHALASMPEELVDEDVARRGRRGRLKDVLDPERLNVTAWTRSCAIWALRDEETIRALADAPDEDVRETARFVLRYPNRRSNGGTAMLTVERVLILRSVQMFQLTPDHILAELAGILKEIDLEPNTEVIKQGDLGDCMFVIVHGAVKVHRDGEVLASLGPRDIVGEMSVLDPEPRSASVTTTAATRLLRIDRADFYDLMADRIEIAQGVMSVLCQRLRSSDSRAV